jgi:hypothetical protein
MTTSQILERLADAMDELGQDHAQRLARIEGMRQWTAVKEAELARAFETFRAAVNVLESTMRGHLADVAKLGDAELAETAGQAAIEPQPQRPKLAHILGNGGNPA